MTVATYELVETTPTHTIVKLTGRLDMAGVGEVEHRLALDVTARRNPTIIDMAEVTFIGSLGIGTLVMIAKSLHHHEATLVLEAVGPSILQTLRQTGMTNLMPIATDRGESLRLIGQFP
jgi:anti-anti-sigma factor